MRTAETVIAGHGRFGVHRSRWSGPGSRPGLHADSPSVWNQHSLAHALKRSGGIRSSSRACPGRAAKYETMVIVPDRVDRNKDADLLVSALEHVVRWNEFHRTSALQAINFFLLTAAVLGTAYVSALNGHQDAIAGVVALAGGGAAGGTYLIFHRQNSISHLADVPLREIQGRIADALGIDSLRMVEDTSSGQGLQWRRSAFIVNVSFPLIIALSLAAAFYAWLR
jgi:hypothetical protein